ncbi:methylthioribulose 1-phosphate dehydratase [Candidatus Albibeggiatoa sp. nov. NOAA]|uniref:methylthioribulose 1-phosphate dehydratase n=1 Tax=Candidatus Albibeggiatoa sp. nov. NOAA TaxID=3162724 RepID=UPI0032FB2188|nr:methylthioribulose 1-phosphate dehydratase [Thiotrichaceae bacterium]
MYDHTLFTSKAKEICEVGQFLFTRGWSPATSSNYSCRLDAEHIAITVSGQSKGELTPHDVMVVDVSGQAIDIHKKPSAETLLHTMLYERDTSIGAILHTHSVNATVLSKFYEAEGYLHLEGYEVLKAFTGTDTHDTRFSMPIFPNTQDMVALSQHVNAYLDENPAIHGYLLAGHGLYTWGESIADARRHIEACEFLFECEILNLQIKK